MVKGMSRSLKEGAKSKIIESRHLNRYLYTQIHGSIFTTANLKKNVITLKAFYINLMVATKQTPLRDTQKTKRKESKHTATQNHSSPKVETIEMFTDGWMDK